MRGDKRVLPCPHWAEDPDLQRLYPNGCWDVNLTDHYGLEVTIAEVGTLDKAQAIAAAPTGPEWTDYLKPYKEDQHVR